MTLLEMIRRYERVKKDIVEPRGPITHVFLEDDSLAIVNRILKDLHSVEEQQPSWVTVRVKILSMIDKAIANDDPDGAHVWAQTLQILPS